MTSTRLIWRLSCESFADPTRVVLAVASTIALGVAQLYLTWLVKEWIEGPFLSADVRMMTPILLGGAGALGVSVVALFSSRYLIASVNLHTLERLRNRAIARVLLLDVAGARSFSSGDVLARLLNDASLLADFLNTLVRRVGRESLVVVGALAMLFVLQWRWALALSLVVPVVVLILAGFGSVIRRWGARSREAMGTVGSTLSEQLQGFTTIKAYQAEAFETRRFARANASFTRQAMRVEYWSAMLLSVVFLLVGLAVLALVYVGNLQLSAGAVSRGTLVAFCLYAAQIVEPVRRLSEFHAALQTMLAAAARVYALIDLRNGEPADGQPLPRPVRGEVRFDQVSFAYRPDEPVLDRVCFAIAAQEHVALVGETGAGKSTIAGLLVRFYRAGAGAIQVDGVDVDEMALADLRRAVCVVEQDPFMFSGPLVDNLRYGSWDAPRARVEEAVTLAGLEPLVASLPGGLDAVLSEGGTDLSGGQKQRIALARAIVRDPAVLVLDEATGAIDSQTEAIVFDRLGPWLSRRTVLAITHRLATATRFPRVIALHRGCVAGDGAPAALIESCPVFADLFAGQVDPLDVSSRVFPRASQPV